MAAVKPDHDRELTASALAQPWSYAQARLGMTLHPKQKAVLRDWGKPGCRIAYLCGNEVGKTSRVATAAILWHAEILGGLVVSTAGVRRQVTKQLVPNLKLHSPRFPGWKFTSDAICDAHGRQRYVGFTAANQGNFQGFHDLDGPLAIILDEAAAIKDDIFLAAEERCNPTRFLVMGSPLDPTGKFFEVATSPRLAKFYTRHQLKQTECTKDKPGGWLDPEIIKRRIEKWGAEHPIVLSSVFAEFALRVEGALLSMREWDNCKENPPPYRAGGRHVWLDFAAGRDANAIGIRIGNFVRVESFHETNTMATVGRMVMRLNKLRQGDLFRTEDGQAVEFRGLEPHEVEGDADGMGVVFCDALREAGWPVLKFHANGTPLRKSEDYAGRSAECWTEGAAEIRGGEWILDAGEECRGQAINRKSARDSKGRLKVESKEDMAKRGVGSPDEADVLFGAMGVLPRATRAQVMGAGVSQSDWQNLAEAAVAGGDEQGVPAGGQFE
jgi:hypothetical protein